ncbi:MAG: aminotransferase class V-fold PLP-dependent enzyme [Actinobacteria bacterium]|nr:aminotransferase class V-fold PLP-dependent enzyme [Actinomycetota bacterium]
MKSSIATGEQAGECPASTHAPTLPLYLVGQGAPVPLATGGEASYVDLDAAASTPALPGVVSAVEELLPWYASVHRGAGIKSRLATSAYEDAREAILSFCRDGSWLDSHVAVICRNTTEAINHLAYRLRLSKDDVVLTTVVEHHANLLPWQRAASCRFIECERDGTFSLEAAQAALHASPKPKLFALTGASNVTGWLPPVDDLIAIAHEQKVPVLVDGAQLAPHRPLPVEADFLAFSGHKMYAPFGAGALIGPRKAFEDGDPFLAGGGAVDLVDLNEVEWSAPPEREEAGTPNVMGAVALHAAIKDLQQVGWDAISAHEQAMSKLLRSSLASIPGVRVLGPGSDVTTLGVATFTVEGSHHGLVAARLSAEWGIGVRHGCFCAHPYLLRLLGVGQAELEAYRADIRRGVHSTMPGAVRASASLGTSEAEISRLVEAVGVIASGKDAPLDYHQDQATGDFWPVSAEAGWLEAGRGAGHSCSRG